jgi:hypothetical protein
MAARNSYQNGAGPATAALAVTPHDTNTVDYASLYVGGAGNITLTTLHPTTGVATDVLFTGVPAGTILPVHCTRVKATGTTATSIVGML